MQNIRKRITLDNDEFEPLWTSQTITAPHRRITRLRSHQCPIVNRKVEKSTNTILMDQLDLKPSYRVSPKLLHVFLGFIALITVAILVLLIFATINLSRMRSEMNAAGDHNAKVIERQISRFYEAIQRTQSNIEPASRNLQLPDISPSASQPDQMNAAEVEPIEGIVNGIRSTSVNENNQDTRNAGSTPSWHDPTCSTIRCKKTELACIIMQLLRFYEAIQRTQSNIEPASRNLQLPDISPSASQPDQMNAAEVEPIEGIVNGIRSTSVNENNQDTRNAGSTPSWHDPTCSTIRCKKTDIDRPPIVVISLDGFAKEYVERGIVKTLDLMAECGTTANFMYPTFPSKTFPNHYSIATGLYPEAHGIVDNHVHAPEISRRLEYIPRTNDARYYKGEPIWAIAEKNGLRSACLFWAGCWQNISGVTLTYNMRYNRSFSFRQRVDQIVKWLSLPEDQRPHLIMAYLSQPDTVGHFRKSEREVDVKLVELDRLLDYLFSTLHSKRLLNCVNILIVSDHGMQKLKKRYYLNEFMNTAGLIISSGVVSRIELTNSGRTLNELRQRLRCANNGSEYRIYDKKHIPKRYHYAKSERIGDLVLEGMPGISLFADRGSDVGVVADHGYDYLVDSMHAIFYARGPTIRPKLLLEPFQNIELFNLIADLLGLANTFPNNGTYGSLHRVLLDPPKSRRRTQSKMPYPCPALSLLDPRKVTPCDSGCERIADGITSSLSSCLFEAPFTMIGFSRDVISYCYIFLCSITALTSTTRLEGYYSQPLAIYEPLYVLDLQEQPSGTVGPIRCTVVHDQFERNCDRWNEKRRAASASPLQYYGLLANTHSTYNSVDRVQALLYDSFIDGPFMHLQNLTYRYVHKYGHVIVVTGTIFDYDSDGLADSVDVFRLHELSEGLLHEQPSHVFRILLRCEDGRWSADGHSCYDAQQTRVLAFILPNTPDDLNCLKPRDYLLVNTARIRDIELLTGLEFFTDRNRYEESVAIQLRTYIMQTLWDY
ncbi:Ectonucleotide pyrophosphatase/phosphodiesterase C27A7.1 [Toxocara canis]|uniref:Ectonucleotide pyrophosphatase/phosphodiesterase C27A7.1 n=1 Tax=Toxocara canis TaxID=6265 RepID=A0A0B2VWE6_TOXCA|nr:Ectonucleotide pyrophosphatase/phosphodiesterase C27A7.1 [Toxocara canis]